MLLGIGIGFGLGGCESSSNDKNDGDSTSERESNSTESSASQKDKTGSSNSNSDQKMIGNIPYDVFHDDPLAIAQINDRVAEDPKVDAKKENGGDPEPEVNTDVAQSDVDWKKLMPKEVLESEIKQIRNRLTRYTQSVGQFKQNIFQIPTEAAALTLLAAIVIDHPDEFGWKENAKHVRDLSAKMLSEKLMATNGSYKQVSEPFLNIIDILDGNLPDGLDEAKDQVDLADVVDFKTLMFRAKQAEEWTKTNCGSEAGMKENVDQAIREAHVIAAIGEALKDESYGWTDEEFNKFADPFRDNALKMTTAIATESFEAFDMGLNQVSQQCTQCHTIFKE